MTKLLITADIHNGHGDGKASLWAMRVMREYAKENNIHDIAVLGDLFDQRDHLAIDTISSVSEFFKVADEDYKQSWIMFPGNHDMFLRNSWDINSMQFLSTHVNLIEKFSKFEIAGQTFWVIPFIHHEDVYMEAVEHVNKMASDDDILLTHIGVNGAIMNMCFLHKNWNVVSFVDTKFKFIFTGHFHIHQEVENDPRVVYPGSPVAFRFDEGIADHGFLVYDIEKSKWEFIKTREVADELGIEGAPPDYVTIFDTDDYEEEEFKELVNGNNVKFIQTKDYTQNELNNLRDQYSDTGAKKLVWSKKQEKTEIEELRMSVEDISKKEIMEMYIDKNGIPPDVNKKLLLKLDEIVCKEADERIAKEEANAD